MSHMGGERETIIKRSGENDIRLHESGGNVHFHDDKAGIKVAMPSADFWERWGKIKERKLDAFNYNDDKNHSTLTLEISDNGEIAVFVDPQEPALKGDVFHAIDKFVNPTTL